VRLADFIEGHLDPILAEWVTFARASGPAGSKMDLAALRDHAREMLASIVVDLRTAQTKSEQAAKSKGDAAPAEGAAETAAEVHGAGRATSGFTVGEMVAEYRALRASVIRLWTEQCGNLAASDMEDLMRFNEAIDQSLAESITRYTDDIDRSKEMFIAVLGHDLRSPLSGILMASQFMLEEGRLHETDAGLAQRVVRSATRMTRMIGDLLDFTRGRLGSGLPINRQEMDLGVEAAQAVAEMESSHPGRRFEVDAEGDLSGAWDASRITQLLVNLLANAAVHGSVDEPVVVRARGRAEDVVLRVANHGTPIAPEQLPSLFSPFKRIAPGAVPSHAGAHLGLGLYIVEQIVTAHGGTIDVASSAEEGTVFTVRLPR
jgi:signal transduction histidine kinase